MGSSVGSTMRRISSDVMEGCKNFTEEGQSGGLGSRIASPSILLLDVIVLSEESANTKVNEHVKANTRKYEQFTISTGGDFFIVLLSAVVGVLSFRSDTAYSRFGYTWYRIVQAGESRHITSTRWNRYQVH